MSDKVAVVTGSNKGIGYEIVRGLLKKFDGLVYLTSRNEQNGKSACEKLEKEGLKPLFYLLDIENKESIQNFANYLKQKHGGIDILINNAAVFIKKDDGLNKEQEAIVSMRINFISQLNVCEALFPLLRPNARVVNITSRLGLLNEIKTKSLRDKLKDPNCTIEDVIEISNQYIEACRNGTFSKDFPTDAYNMTKVLMNAITPIQQRNIDKDSSKTGIIISSVCPGYCKTDMTRNAGFLTSEQGAETPIYLCLLPENFDGPKGAFWAENKPINWETGSIVFQSFGMIKKFISSKFF